MYKLALMFISLFLLTSAPAGAAGKDDWVVTQLSGDARVVHPGLQPVSLKVNGELAPGDTLLTGPTGRATLVRGADYIVIAPRSELRLPSTPQPTGFTRVIQNLGTLLFKVQHTGIPHFAVDTPMLAAVVKGTTFTVVVDQQRSAVQVIQGVVAVSAVDGGMSRLVEGGRTVFVNRANPKALLDADKPAPTTSAPSSTSVKVSAAGDSPLAVISALTGGLVRADLGSPQSSAPTAVPVAGTALLVTSASRSPAAGSATGSSVTITPVTSVVAAPGTTAVAATTPAVTVASVATPVVTASAPAIAVPSVTLSPVTTPTGGASSVITASVSVPSVSTPSVTVPSLTTPTLTVPSVTTATLSVSSVTVPSLSTPTVTVPSVTAPTATVANITTPTVTVPTVTAPTVTVANITTPTVAVPSITTPSVTVPSVSVPTITTPTLTIPTVTIPLPTLKI